MIAIDKAKHFLIGAVIAVLFVFWAGPWWALAASAAAGALKEAYDATGRGQVELDDFIWTALGWVPVALVWHWLT